MKVGSLVETVGDFEDVRRQWGFPYPKKGDVLTVSYILDHPNEIVRKKGIVLLYFVELPDMVGICDKTIYGQDNFVELLLPMQVEEILNKRVEIKISEEFQLHIVT